MSKYGVVSGPYFPVFGPEITPYLDTFHAMLLCKRGYPQNVADAQIKTVSKKTVGELFEKPDRKEMDVPLLVTYHPRFHNLSAIIRTYFTFLYAEEEKVKRFFTPAPFVSFRSGYCLRNHRVRAKVYPLLGKKLHFVVDTFESLVTKKVYKINHSFNCDSKCLIYLYSCKVCGIQYVGSIVDRFRLRWNNYKTCQRNAADGGTPNQHYFH